MLCSSDNESEGVSPVIGVILMVAITVVLAAVVGTFILDLTGNLDRKAEASVTFDETPYNGSNGELRIQLIAMQNADKVIMQAPNGTNLGEMTTVGETTVIAIDGPSDYPNGVIAAGDSVTAIGVLEGSKSTLQTYETHA